MSPLNRGPLLGPRVPPIGLRPPPPPPPRFGGRLPPPGLPPRMPPPPPMSPGFGPIRQRLPPPPRPGGVARPPAGPMPLFGPRPRGMSPIVPPMGIRPSGPRGPMIRPWLRRSMPPQMMNQMRPRFNAGNGNAKGKPMSNVKKANKLEELELKKPWMTDEIRSEIQKKNKLYAKAKKNKDAKEWEEFKDLRNKVTRMIRDAKNDYLAKHPEQAHLYPDEAPYDQRDENSGSPDDEEAASHYCEVCDRVFPSEECMAEHNSRHKVCGIDGCAFSAHPVLLEKHIGMQHNTGLYQRMKNLSTPEDIEKWLIERKKRYPTKANVELKKAVEEEKIKRGEVIKEKKNVAPRKTKRSSNTKDRRRRPQKHVHHVSRQDPERVRLYRGLRSFPGTACLKERGIEERVEEEPVQSETEDANNQISDEEEILQTPEPPKPQPCTFSLVANYGSDSDDDEAPEEVPVKRIRTDDQPEPKGNDKTEESTKLDANPVEPSPQPNSDFKKVKSREKHNNKQSRPNSRDQRQNGSKRTQPQRTHLLERLLSRSIQHERNLICQCIKYIVDNNFFD